MKFAIHFLKVIWTETRPHTILLFMWKWITSILSFIRYETNGNIFNLWGPVFPTGPFFSGSVFLRSRVPLFDKPLIRKYRSSRPKVFCKKGVLKNVAKFTGKHLCQGLYFNKVEHIINNDFIQLESEWLNNIGYFSREWNKFRIVFS